ncbi:S8 family peptidase [Meridianimarinicoccus aquatilis]|uniref:Peptidase S8/S53 domain-containing protein n=1 Tax=Meridianimarinicoccus aquatilis TaxID=2552766 RepID=A0A4R6AQ37_9RHOB|nr:S8 family peptidase [Fluviibacterium aquatile]TDL84708.1 hypothetical protein E2L05_17425 [Fluviibacterium aquatile]
MRKPLCMFGLVSEGRAGRRLLACAALLLGLAGCQTGGGAADDSSSSTSTLPEAPARSTSLADAYYVTEFDADAVRAVRNATRFVAQTLTIDYTFTGNPLLSGVTMLQNAFEASRIEYAHSVGLSGAGQTVAINDTSIDLSHPEFAGKTVSTSGTTTAADFHGTAVASILAGSATSGDMMGVAPGAYLHIGQVDFSVGVTFDTLSRYFDDARAIGAIANSNSWNFIGATFANTDYSSFNSGGRATLLTALRNYAQGGVIIFGVQNDFGATSVNQMNGLPLAYPDLQQSWIAGMSAVPIMENGVILSARRQSAPCNEAGPYCLAANGTVLVADTSSGAGSYTIVSGTSFVAPQIAGAVALLAEAFPNLTPQQLRDRLLVTADNSWFAAEGTVEFEGGLTHGYNSEFGHGFMDLQAALLPIGQVAVPLEGGTVQPVSVPIVLAGGASGDALVQGLAAQGIFVTDALGAAFSTRAANLTAQLPRIEDNADQLYTAMDLDQFAAISARHAALSGGASSLVPGAASLMPAQATAATFAGLDSMDIPFAAAGSGAEQDATAGTWLLRTYAPRADDDTESVGLGLVHRRDIGRLGLEFGVEMARSEGSMLGIYVPGALEQMHTDTLSVQAGLGWRLSADVGLHARAEWGFADGPGAGVIDSFNAVEFTSYEIGIDTRGLLASNDVLSLSARAPLAISSGNANLRLATGLSPGGGVTFSSVPVGLTPEDRQIDLALDYLSPLGRATSFGLGLRRSWNYGHIAGETGLNAVAVLQHRF